MSKSDIIKATLTAAILYGPAPKTADLIDRRVAACGTCVHAIPTNTRIDTRLGVVNTYKCKECSCTLVAKITNKNGTCPLGLWNDSDDSDDSDETE